MYKPNGLIQIQLFVPKQHARRVIRQALERCGGNVSRAARTLGLTRRTMQYRMSKYEIPTPRA